MFWKKRREGSVYPEINRKLQPAMWQGQISGSLFPKQPNPFYFDGLQKDSSEHLDFQKRLLDQLGITDSESSKSVKILVVGPGRGTQTRALLQAGINPSAITIVEADPTAANVQKVLSIPKDNIFLFEPSQSSSEQEYGIEAFFHQYGANQAMFDTILCTTANPNAIVTIVLAISQNIPILFNIKNAFFSVSMSKSSVKKLEAFMKESINLNKFSFRVIEYNKSNNGSSLLIEHEHWLLSVTRN